MNVNSKKSVSWMMALIALGMLALYAGPMSLVVLIPAAGFVCYEAGAMLKSDRH